MSLSTRFIDELKLQETPQEATALAVRFLEQSQKYECTKANILEIYDLLHLTHGKLSALGIYTTPRELFTHAITSARSVLGLFEIDGNNQTLIDGSFRTLSGNIQQLIHGLQALKGKNE